MKITISDQVNFVVWSELKCGDLFIMDFHYGPGKPNTVFMKIDTDSDRNAVYIDTGRTACFDTTINKVKYIRLQGELIVKA